MRNGVHDGHGDGCWQVKADHSNHPSASPASTTTMTTTTTTTTAQLSSHPDDVNGDVDCVAQV